METALIKAHEKPGLIIFDRLDFEARRFFIMSGLTGETRGAHAHRECRQLLHCLEGSVELVADTGNKILSINLNSRTNYYMHETLTWLTINFLEPSRVLVLAEFEYDEADYIRNYEEFLKESQT